MNTKRYVWLALFSILLVMAGCDKKENPTESTSNTVYVGTFISNLAVDTSAGLIVLTVNSSGSATGIVKMYENGLTTVTLSGTLSGSTFTATASDGTPVAGTLNGTTIAGTAANGEATFSVTVVSDPVTLETFSGTFQSTSGPTESGQLIFCTAATTVWGVALLPGESPDPLTGTISGTALSVHHAHGSTQVAAGTRSGNTWSGTYTSDVGGGTWSVTLVP